MAPVWKAMDWAAMAGGRALRPTTIGRKAWLAGARKARAAPKTAAPKKAAPKKAAPNKPAPNKPASSKSAAAGKAAAARLIPLWLPDRTPEEALADLTASLEPLLPIDVALLGMGTDLHTASLFPQADRLDEALASDAPPLLPIRAPAAPEPRISLTLPVLKDAFAIHILITGPEKRAALEKAGEHALAEAPVTGLLGDAQVHWAE